jgi:Uma2 family endonuclease
MSATSPVERPHTYGDIRAWGDETRWELIDGQAYAMAGPNRLHQHVLTRLLLQLVPYFDGRGCQVVPAPFDVRLPYGDEADDEVQTVVQPDIVVVCDRSKLDDRGCRGAPDVVIEVLSPSTAGRDQVIKRAIYERHGVGQYWLVHPTDRVVTIYRRGSEGGFSTPEIFEARGIVPIQGHEGLELDWDRAFVDVPPAR